MTIVKRLFVTHVLFFSLAFSADVTAANGLPDPTEGGKRINKCPHRDRWVGPVGIFCTNFKPSDKHLNQLLVKTVDKGSPADGILAEGDVILGADGTGAANVPLFKTSQSETTSEIADAITEAEARKPALLTLLIWRPAQKEDAVVEVSMDDMGDMLFGGSGDKKKKPAKKKAKFGAEKKAKKEAVVPSLFGDEDDESLDANVTRPKKTPAEDTNEWTDSFTFEAIDGQGKTATGTVTFKISDQGVGVAIYDGFDYPGIGLHGLEGGSST